MDAQHPCRKKLRLEGYDYARCGAYFVTICTKERQMLFWKGVGANCVRPGAAPPLSPMGEVVRREILRLDEIYEEVQVENYCIMPNHVHLLLMIQPDGSGRTQFAPTLSRVVKQFKGAVTKRIGKPVWQRLFFDRIVRNQESYQEIWRYVDENPLKWQLDDLCQELLEMISGEKQ